MALINCPECKKEISDKAQTCPHCGFPVKNESDKEDRYDIVMVGIEDDSYITRIKIVSYLSEMKDMSKKEIDKLIEFFPQIVFSDLSLSDAIELESILVNLNADVEIVPVSLSVELKRSIARKEEKINENKNTICCPRCGSTAVQIGERGYSIIAGFIGSGKTVNRCGKCGFRWEPGIN